MGPSLFTMVQRAFIVGGREQDGDLRKRIHHSRQHCKPGDGVQVMEGLEDEHESHFQES